MTATDAVKNFNYGAANHAANPPKKAKGKAKPDVPFQLETDGPIYHRRGAVDPTQMSILSAVFGRAADRGDTKAQGRYTERMLDILFTPETVDALMMRLGDPDDYFNEDLFKRLVRDVTEEHSGGRPTASPRTSSRSRQATGTKSTARSSSKASTSGNSRSTAR